jgi:hypothetical protein
LNVGEAFRKPMIKNHSKQNRQQQQQQQHHHHHHHQQQQYGFGFQHNNNQQHLSGKQSMPFEPKPVFTSNGVAGYEFNGAVYFGVF